MPRKRKPKIPLTADALMPTRLRKIANRLASGDLSGVAIVMVDPNGITTYDYARPNIALVGEIFSLASQLAWEHRTLSMVTEEPQPKRRKRRRRANHK